MHLGLTGSLWIVTVLSSLFIFMVSCSSIGCSWEKATDACGLSRHRTSCHFYKKSSLLATQQRWERAKESVTANLALNCDLPRPFVNPSHRIGRPKPIAAYWSLAEERRGSASCIFDTPEPSLVDPQHCIETDVPQNDNNVEMNIDVDTSDEWARPVRQIPRHYVNINRSEEDLNISDNADNHNVSTQNSGTLPAQARIRRLLLMLADTLQTTFNSFGICRLYPHHPSFEPDKFVSSSLLVRTCPNAAEGSDSPLQVYAPPYPFANMTIYWLISWMNSGSSRVLESKVASLINDIMLAKDFDPKHLQGFLVRRSL
ncbi:uncharacterized protein BJ212DRAFT_1476874 [Suillus subaureus]|uniref:Uncharacterized protein n=1 Tax=Suillus subaureus TaxID=48587 RepID=A0A9P7JGT2_9AGAM|nr:uncharacterized protein BJ212DRAFT_1476874 [Suillus subaureus]KAG1822445.1 hypothetical protein BJ212DRAFT_1476874 [Suillus subaureus]